MGRPGPGRLVASGRMDHPSTGRTASARPAALLAALTRPSADHTPLLAHASSRRLRHLPHGLALAATASLLPGGITVPVHDHGLNPGIAGRVRCCCSAARCANGPRPGGSSPCGSGSAWKAVAGAGAAVFAVYALWVV